MKRLSCLFLAVFVLASAASAHPGGLDKNGGHTNRKTGEYHYHRGPNAGQTRSSESSPLSGTKMQTQSTKKAVAVDLQANGMYYVRVTRVVDGDTLEVMFDTGAKEKVRMVGVDTPETAHPKKEVQYYGKEASDYTKKSLTDKKVWLQMDVQIRDKYQRLLGYIWTDKPNNVDNRQEVRAKMFNARLLLEGYGQVMTIQPNSKYADTFVEYQREAREGKKGLWGKE